MSEKIILASGSPYRKQLLDQLKIEFTCISPDVDESEVKARTTIPKLIALELAKMKAEKVFQMNPDALVIGSDQICALGPKMFDKPGTPENAFDQLKSMTGKTHSLFTAVAVMTPKDHHVFLNETKLKMRNLTDDEISRYIELDNPTDCAGSYKIESLGISLFDSIETEDYSSIIGLPLMELSEILRKYGVLIP